MISRQLRIGMIPYQVQVHGSNQVSGVPPGTTRTFRVLQCPFWIDCSGAVLEQIRQEVESGLISPDCARETGGVLFGTSDAGRIHIEAHRSLYCEHAMGPGFVLSANDEKRLWELIATPRTEPALSGLQPLGWYHSHVASKIFLSDRDGQVHARFFGAPLQVALVLRPAAERATRAGFFFWESSGIMRKDASYEEFVLQCAPAVQEIRKSVIAEVPAKRPQPSSLPAAPDPAVCPKCGSKCLKRSHRTHSVERLRGAFGYFPYRCQECLSRSFIKKPADLWALIRPNSGHRPEQRKRAWLRTRREFLLWGAGIAGFLLILLYMARDAGPKQDQP